MSDHWLRVESRTACYAVAFVGTRIVHGAPYSLAIMRRLKTSDVRVFKRHVESSGAKTVVLRGHDGPCMLEDE